MNATIIPVEHLGIGIDTARYGHRVTFVRRIGSQRRRH